MASATQPNGTQVDLSVPTAPNGYQAGDLLIAFVYVGWDANFDTSNPITAPAGWTQIDQDSVAHPSIAGGGAGDRVAAFYLLSTGTEPASYTFSWGGTHVVGFVGRIVVYRNVDQVAPLTSAGYVLSSGIGAEPISLALPFTTTGAARLVCSWAALADDVAFVMPTSMTPRTQVQNDSSYVIIGDFGLTTEDAIRVTQSVCDESIAAATTSTRTASIDTTAQQSDGDRFVWGIAIVVKPAS
jgi:hypothetical protein